MKIKKSYIVTALIVAWLAINLPSVGAFQSKSDNINWTEIHSDI